MKLLGLILISFFFFVAVLPLVGAISMLTFTVLFPYLLGGIISTAVLLQFMPWAEAWWIALLLGLIWAALVLGVRLGGNERFCTGCSWHQGHYMAALIVLGLGLPLLIERKDGHYHWSRNHPVPR